MFGLVARPGRYLGQLVNNSSSLSLPGNSFSNLNLSFERKVVPLWFFLYAKNVVTLVLEAELTYHKLLNACEKI